MFLLVHIFLQTKFRWLAAIYDVLRDKEKRAIYDRVLVEGLPDWRMPVFYYRRMRKMGLAEGLAYIFGIFTVCQYFINWAAFWEKRFTLREVLGAHAKRIQKKVTCTFTHAVEQNIFTN